MPALNPEIDPDGLLEYSVVFTDRSLNHMSTTFQGIMRDISTTLKSVYNAPHIALVPGGGTYAMESVARQFATDQTVTVLRNGWFSYRWTQIFDAGNIPKNHHVLKAQRTGDGPQAPFAPAAIKDVVAHIQTEKPSVVFAPHVETSSGMILPDDYLTAVGAAAREVGALFVLDCIASGCIWVDMAACNVDVLISAPQKGWSASPSAGIVMMNDRAHARMTQTQSSSFALSLATWSNIMAAYENGGHAYHATMPTDAIRGFHAAMKEAEALGFDTLKSAQATLGKNVRAALEQRQIQSVADAGFQAPGVVVSYTADPDVKSGAKFRPSGLQIAAGVPLQCDEGDDFSTFRLGLFGLDKLTNIDRTVTTLTDALDQI